MDQTNGEAITPYPSEAWTERVYHFPRLAAAEAHVQTVCGEGTLPMFAFDRATNSASKKYMVGGWPALWKYCARMTKAGKGYFYELLQADVPLRVFFDVDLPGKVEGIETIVDHIRTTVRYCFRRYCASDAPDEWFDPVQLDASSAVKTSRHLIFPMLVMKNMDHVKGLVGAVVSRLEGVCPTNGIDTAVYTKGRLFRVLGSAKRSTEQATPFRRIDRPDVFDAPSFFSSLVSAYRTEEGGWEVVPKVARVFEMSRPPTPPSDVPPPKRARREHSEAKWDEVIQRGARLLRATHPDVTTLYPVRQGDFVEFTLSPGIACPNNNNTPHRSNKTWFKYRVSDGLGWYACCDPDCHHFTWGKKKYQHLIRNRFKN